MKQIIMKRLVIAAIALLAVPTSLLAQKEKEKEKTKDDKKEVQRINIVRTGDLNVKTVIEIDGDKIKINGKDAKDEKDIHVNVNTSKGANVYSFNYTPRNYDMNFNNGMTFFSEDNNRPMLGITTEGNDNGAEVESVTKESAAEKAGLKKGDIITKIGDKKIESTDDVTEAVRSYKPGDKATITYLRDGKTQTTTAELGKWKGINMNAVTVPRLRDLQLQMHGLDGQQWNMTPVPPMTFNGDVFVSGRPRLGLSIQDIDDGVGVKVLDVDNESIASKAGIKKDDIILGINDTDIKSTDDVIRATRARENSTYRFKIKRGGNVQTIEVKIPRKLKTADL